MTDVFDHLLDLEKQFYQEGYDLGLEDGVQAGLTEGKVFGIEKAFEKAVEMGKLHGRARVWQERLPGRNQPRATGDAESQNNPSTALQLRTFASNVDPLPTNARLERHIESLLISTDKSTLSSKNSDEAVAAFDERMTKATARSKVISNILNEPLEGAKTDAVGIEESKGLTARQ